MKWVESFNTCTRLLDDSLCVDSELSIDELSVEVRIHFIPTNTISTRLWICLAENVQIIILRPEYFSPRLVLSLNLRRKKKNSYRRTSSPGRDLHGEEEEGKTAKLRRLIFEFVGSQHSCRREERVIASNPWRKALNPADWPRVFICMRGFRLLYELTVERHIRHGRRFAFQPVTEKAIVNDRWTSNGQHVLHTTAHKTYAYVSTAPEKKTPRTPFCLNERGAPLPSQPVRAGNACATSAFLLRCRPGKIHPTNSLWKWREKWPLSPSRVPPPLSSIKTKRKWKWKWMMKMVLFFFLFSLCFCG